MNILNNKFYNQLEGFTNFIILNLLWLITSIPIITAYPATAAMFGVVRKWIMGQQVNIFVAYFSLFKEDFIQRIWIGFIWTLLGIFLYMDYKLINPMSSFVQLILFVLFLVMAILYLFTFVYIFPIMVHFSANWFNVLRNSFFLSLSNPFSTILSLLIICLSIFIIYIFPISLFFVESFAAYIIYYLCSFTFKFIEPRIIEKK